MQTGANKILRMLVLGLDGFLFQDIRFNIADGNIGIARIKINCANPSKSCRFSCRRIGFLPPVNSPLRVHE